MFEFFTSLGLLPLIIFVVRVIDVSLATFRVVLISQSKRHWATVVGFFESFIWILIVSQIINDVQSPINLFAYAAGFAGGTYAGMLLEKYFAMGKVLIRVITQKNAHELIHKLQNIGHEVTHLPAIQNDKSVTVFFLALKRKEIKDTLSLIKELNPDSFYTISDIRSVHLSHDSTPIKRPRQRFFKKR